MTNKKNFHGFSFFFFICFVHAFLHLSTCRPCDGAETDGMFVFGSSLVDNGNNYFLKTGADYMPYGIDFPLGTTGRYSNGKNVIDALGELLKLPSFIPAFKDPMTKGSNIVHGVDFASGGSGILDETGSGNVITLNQQIQNFEEVTLPDLKLQLNSTAPLSNYLFILGSGSNDYQAYFQEKSTRTLNIQDFSANLTETFSTQIQKLYSLGARKFVLISIYPIGCIPLFMKSLNEGCIKNINKATQLFNNQMKSLVNIPQPKMQDSRLVYVDSYQIIMDIILNPTLKGFRDTSSPCCEVPSPNKGEIEIMCKRDGYVCSNRRIHVFFDRLHPTEAVNHIIANKAFSSTLKTEVFPINVKQLAQLQMNPSATILCASAENNFDRSQ